MRIEDNPISNKSNFNWEKKKSTEKPPHDTFEKSNTHIQKEKKPENPLDPAGYIENLKKTIRPEDIKRRSVSTGASPTEGTTRSFWRWDFAAMPPGFKKIDATCRAVGKNAFIFVDDKEWNKTVKKEDILKLKDVFENKTPDGSVNKNQGIFDIESRIFGNPPDVIDREPRVYLLISDMGKYNGNGFDGYFNPFDEMPEKDAWEKYHQHSNEVEILYLNSGSNETPIASDYMLSVTAHELQHLIHFNYDATEESWINESCSEAAMTATGYFTDIKHLKHYADNPSSPLIVTDYVDYGACLLWGTFLMEQLGTDFFPPFVSNPLSGSVSITDTLKSLHRPENFRSLFDQWVVANFASGKSLNNPKYSYKSFSVPPMKIARKFTEFPGEHESTLKNSGIDYIGLGEEKSSFKETDTPKKYRLTLKLKNPRETNTKDYNVILMNISNNELKTTHLNFQENESQIVSGEGNLFLALYSLGGNDFSYNLKVEEIS